MRRIGILHLKNSVNLMSHMRLLDDNPGVKIFLLRSDMSESILYLHHKCV